MKFINNKICKNLNVMTFFDFHFLRYRIGNLHTTNMYSYMIDTIIFLHIKKRIINSNINILFDKETRESKYISKNIIKRVVE